MAANTVDSTPKVEFAPEDTVDDSHVHFDDGYKIAFAEIASLFEDIQADLRIITDRADDRKKGVYIRDADTVANNPANIAQAARMYNSLQQSGKLDMINAELGNPADLSNTSDANFNIVKNTSSTKQSSSSSYRQSPGYGNTSAITGTDDIKYYEDTVPLDKVKLKTGSGAGSIKYGMEEIRNLPIQAELFNILETAASTAGVNVLISAGGQVPISEGGIDGKNRYDSNRFDKGFAAEVILTIDVAGGTERLDTTNQDHLPIMLKFAEACRDAGATAIAMGNGYKDNIVIHVDIAWKGQTLGVLTKILPDRYWGGGPNAEAPLYLQELMEPRDNTA